MSLTALLEISSTIVGIASGYSSEARQATKLRYSTPQQPISAKPWVRQNPYDFTGCLAHIDLSEYEETGQILRVTGCLDHNSDCRASGIRRIPAIPLHPHVFEMAVEQLASGASIASIQAKNVEMLSNRAYRDMSTYDPRTANVRCHFLTSDSRQLYRLFNRRNGVDVSVKPEYNIEQWLDPRSSQFRPELYNAIFYYSARAEKHDRLKICIATAEMVEAAWKYSHHGQLIVDRTFGVCSSRLLLFIGMGVDEQNKGVPLVFLLFSAPTGTRATHAGYNTEILRELLMEWKNHLSQARPGAEPFTPFVAITDTDLCERAALLQVWTEIWLLLCKFHLRQCWANKQRTLKLSALGSSVSEEFWDGYISQQLLSLEEGLIATTDHAVAASLITSHRSNLEALRVQAPEAERTAISACAFLDYLVSMWMPNSMWQSWSQYGRVIASRLLNVPMDGVLPTTNHLEAFNGLLKRTPQLPPPSRGSPPAGYLLGTLRRLAEGTQ
ncbi:unnamed protein product [Mycena citricolor]|uniref:MULE transposase domain-containing protein n=1 Tax=Mycena citricolor TaxID=2018698 RepID=A0AAD2GV76_9AGAR|nr:unnamed protein product [Mycena citricolor]